METVIVICLLIVIFLLAKDKIVIKNIKEQQAGKRKLILVSRILWDSLSLKEAFLCQGVNESQEQKKIIIMIILI
jgi:hypothetical protein